MKIEETAQYRDRNEYGFRLYVATSDFLELIQEIRALEPDRPIESYRAIAAPVFAEGRRQKTLLVLNALTDDRAIVAELNSLVTEIVAASRAAHEDSGRRGGPMA